MEAPQKPVKTRASVPNFPKLEEGVLDFWDKERIFQKTLEKTAGGKRFVFFEGPPTANGLPGIHHVIARAFKDIIVRYKALRGFFVERKAGWDTHGLPVEIQVEKALKLSGKKQIEDYGIEKFNAKCKESVLEYKKEWETLTKRIGFWLDMEHPYMTYTNDYIESLWWLIRQIWSKGLLYKGHKVVPHCPRCGTALSSHEVAQGYKDVTEDSVFVKFEVKNPERVGMKGPLFILSWTTTPWTLPGNVALAVGADIKYVAVTIGSETYILAEDRVSSVIEFPLGKKLESEKPLDPSTKIQKGLKGKDLVGLEYEPLYPVIPLEGKKAYYVAPADFVTTDEGTGVVHTAVMYGEDDYTLGEKLDLPKHHTVHRDGTFTDELPKWKGMFVKDAEKDIIEDLRSRGLLYNAVSHTHSYPFCWRCGTPLLYYAKDSWFIAMSKLREQLVANNQQINWVPSHIKDGRFGEWLKEVKDWAFSRERYWGTPLPIWESANGEKICVGSYEELRSLAKDKSLVGETFDPHRPFVDNITLVKNGKEYTRVNEVIDVWFDSGSMPFAQWHYPFENAERVDGGLSFPADYISEAIDQTRGWFYTLLAISTLLGKGAPYKNVICLGHILDEKGQKMSKSKGNILKPYDVIDTYGADPLRMYLATMNPPGEPKRFDTKGLDEVVKKYFFTLWNVTEFYLLYASHGPAAEIKPVDVLDRYILARLAQLVEQATRAFDAFDVYTVGRKLMEFATELSTWYVRRSRERFKHGGEEAQQAVSTLGKVLKTLAQLMAPLTPMYADIIWKKLDPQAVSVHLSSWPESGGDADEDLLDAMETVRLVSELGHALRAEHALRVRQPLPQCVLIGKRIPDAFIRLVAEELNVKEVNFGTKAPTGTEFAKKESGGLTVVLDTTITDELLQEGMLRDIIRHINAQRKALGFTLADTACITYVTEDEDIVKLLEHFTDVLLKDTLSSTLQHAESEEKLAGAGEPLKVKYGTVRFGLEKIAEASSRSNS